MAGSCGGERAKRRARCHAKTCSPGKALGLGNILTTEEHVRRVWEIIQAAV